MTAIKQEDLIQSVADAFQYISYYHPLDYIKALGEAYEREESPGRQGRHRPDPDQLAHVAPKATARSARTPASAWSSSRSACRSHGRMRR